MRKKRNNSSLSMNGSFPPATESAVSLDNGKEPVAARVELSINCATFVVVRGQVSDSTAAWTTPATASRWET